VPEIVSLSRHHDRSGFDCGVPELNSFLKATARQHGDKGISRTFVLSDPARPATILGYFTLTLCEVMTDHLPSAYAKKYPHHGLPAHKFYERYGFVSLPGQALQIFLPLETLRLAEAK
jgi:hypothetical protein